MTATIEVARNSKPARTRGTTRTNGTALRVADTGATYGAVAGADLGTINGMMASFYAAVPAVFTQTFDVNQQGINSVTVAIQAPPSLAIGTMAKYDREARDFIARFAKPVDDAEAAIKAMTAGLLTATFPALQATINTSGAPLTVNGSMVCGAAFPNVSGNSIQLAFADATITIPGDPQSTQILTTLVAPLLLAYLNQVAGGVSVSPFYITIDGINVTFGTPMIAIESGGGDDYVVAYATSTFELPDPGTPWPNGQIFAGFPAGPLNTIAGIVIDLVLKPQGSGGIGLSALGSVSWDYGVELTPSVQLSPGAGNSITIGFSTNTSAGFTWHTPNWLPNTSFGGTISGTFNATAALSAQPDGQAQDIVLTIQNVADFDLSLDVGLPDGIGDIFDELSNAVLNGFGQLLSSQLQNYPITVYTTPTINFSIGGNATTLLLQNVQLLQMADVDGTSLAVLAATPSFQPQAQNVTVKKSGSQRPGPSIARAKGPVR